MTLSEVLREIEKLEKENKRLLYMNDRLYKTLSQVNCLNMNKPVIACDICYEKFNKDNT